METIPVLDHGYVKTIRVDGDDRFIAETARTSTDSSGDEAKDHGLVRRLIRDKHTSPIEFDGLVVEVQKPIFVARQWMRHRTGSFNEFSGRYSVIPDLYYIPELERIQYQSTFNKQGSADSMPTDLAKAIQSDMRKESEEQYQKYIERVNLGMTRELARITLGVNFYTRVRWKIDLNNLFKFLLLREDKHAQWEIQQYAQVLHNLCLRHFPIATEAFENYIQNSVTISPALAKLLAVGLASSETEALSSEAKDFIRMHL